MRDEEAASAPELRDRALYYRVMATDPEGAQASLLFEVAAAAPRRAVLRPNAPNPFNPTTVFEFELAAPSHVDLTLFDVRGKVVRELRADRGAGRHSLVWDGRDAAGRPLAAGVYPYRLAAAGQELRGRAVLVK